MDEITYSSAIFLNFQYIKQTSDFITMSIVLLCYRSSYLFSASGWLSTFVAHFPFGRRIFFSDSTVSDNTHNLGHNNICIESNLTILLLVLNRTIADVSPLESMHTLLWPCDLAYSNHQMLERSCFHTCLSWSIEKVCTYCLMQYYYRSVQGPQSIRNISDSFSQYPLWHLPVV